MGQGIWAYGLQRKRPVGSAGADRRGEPVRVTASPCPTMIISDGDPQRGEPREPVPTPATEGHAAGCGEGETPQTRRARPRAQPAGVFVHLAYVSRQSVAPAKITSRHGPGECPAPW